MSAKTIRRKTRAEAFENSLKPEQLSQLYSWCCVGYKVARLNSLQEWGLKISESSLHRWFHKDDDLKVLSFIANGAHMNSKIEEAYQANPAPEIKTLVNLCKTLVMQLSVKGATDNLALNSANSLFRSVLDFIKEQGKQEDRKLARDQFHIKACEYFLKWFSDKKAQEIAMSSGSNAEKISKLRQTYFKDVDELEKSGQVKLPE